jgi:ribonuclease HI
VSIRLFVDGAARGNPGPSGVGVVVLDPDERVLARYSAYIGRRTNNQAEYEGLIAALRIAACFVTDSTRILMDSELVVRQVSGEYKVKNPGLKALHDRAMRLLRELPAVTVEHVGRSANAPADGLANEAIDRYARRVPG